MKSMPAAVALLPLSSTAVAKPLMLLECEIPKLIAPVRNVVREKWNGFIEIDDEVWSVKDYAFYIENPTGFKRIARFDDNISKLCNAPG